eukprot:6213175-Pleurochrysis_carterae.AAC.5
MTWFRHGFAMVSCSGQLLAGMQTFFDEIVIWANGRRETDRGSDVAGRVCAHPRARAFSRGRLPQSKVQDARAAMQEFASPHPFQDLGSHPLVRLVQKCSNGKKRFGSLPMYAIGESTKQRS